MDNRHAACAFRRRSIFRDIGNAARILAEADPGWGGGRWGAGYSHLQGEFAAAAE